jgi:ketosteroid isomerase-like protein
MEWLGVIREAFDQARQVPERFIDCGDRVLVFVRTAVRGRGSGVDLDEEWAHLVTLGDDGKVVRVQLRRDRDEALEAAGLGSR